jgi:thioredoxin reductase (NADPH)
VPSSSRHPRLGVAGLTIFNRNHRHSPRGIRDAVAPIQVKEVNEYDVIIVGGGPAGLAAGLYTARMNLKTVIVERGPLGGQLLNTELVEDYPGFESILGSDLAVKMAEHARKFGVDVRDFAPVTEVDVQGTTKVVRLDTGEELRAPALIMAAGGLPRYLEVPGEKEFWGRGVSYCAVCDGAFFKGQELAVIGGGDAAVEEGEFLTRYASKVYIVHRRSELRAQPILVDRARANPKIEFVFDATVKEIAGDGKVRKLVYEQGGEKKELAVGGVFIFIGFVPNSGLLKVHVEHDDAGYILTDRNMQTSVEGLWAVGDVRAQLTKQIATAVGDGTTAAVAASMYVAALKHVARPGQPVTP